MAITEIQLQNIRNLNSEDSAILLHECAENLGLITVGSYHDLTKTPKRTIYEYIKIGKIKSLKIDNVIFIIMN